MRICVLKYGSTLMSQNHMPQRPLSAPSNLLTDFHTLRPPKFANAVKM